jgi:hypothetical protein
MVDTYMTLDGTEIPDDTTTPQNSVELNLALIIQQWVVGNLSEAQTRLALSAVFRATPQLAVASIGPTAEAGLGLSRAKAVICGPRIPRRYQRFNISRDVALEVRNQSD